MFEQQEPKLTWNDVALLAREYAVTPDKARDMILATKGQAAAEDGVDTDQVGDNEIPVSGQVIFLAHDRDRDASQRRAAAG